MPSKSIGTVKTKIALLAVESRHLQIWLKDEYETKLQNVTFYYWVIQHIDVLPAKKFSTFRVHPRVWCEHKYWNSCLTGLSKWSAVSCCINSSGIKSREYAVSVISITSVFWILHSMMTHTNQDEANFLREKQAIWMLKEKRKSIRAIAKTKGMEKSRVWKPPATNNYLIGWEITVVHDRQIIKAVKINPKRHVRESKSVGKKRELQIILSIQPHL